MAPRFAILNPSPKRWSDMTAAGDTRKRFCPDCQTHIHAVEQYSDEEIAALRHESPGRLCRYLEIPPLIQPRSRRAIIVGAIFTAVSPLFAQSGRVRIRVMDAARTVVPAAEASLLDPEGQLMATAQSDERGEIVFTGLPIGDSKIKVSSPGFALLMLTVTVRNEAELTLDATLQVGSIEGGITNIR